MPNGEQGTERLRGDLRQLFTRAKLPSSPALAARILALMDDCAADVRDFADVIRTDAALVARLLKTANSVEFAQRNAVTTIERAVTVVGLNRVKTISLGFQLVAHLDRLGGAPFDMRVFWQHALLRACLARTLARRVVPARQEEAFLVGLLLDCGIPLIVQVLGADYAGLYQSALSPAAFHSVERSSFPCTHLDAVAAVATEWKLPELIARPLRQHHAGTQAEDAAPELARLCEIAYFVGNLRFAGDVAIAAEERELATFLAETLGHDEAAFAAAQRDAAAEYRGVAPLYGDFVSDVADVTELLGEANRQLTSLATATDERLIDVEAQRQSIQRDRERLQSALCEYRERAAIDPLTKLLNRGALTDAARRLIEENQDRGTSLGCIFLDVDNFKQLNDTRGHRVGDNVLRAIAALLERDTAGWAQAGRYGGEEFVVLFRSQSLEDTGGRAEALVSALRAIDAASLDCPGPITASLGAAWFGSNAATSAEEMIARADELMYDAKRAGKDRACCAAVVVGEPDASSASPGDDAGAATVRSVGADLPARLAALAHRLNSEESGETFDGFRKQQRRSVVSPCIVHYFVTKGVTMRAEAAVTRNMSTGGMSMLVARSMMRGEAIEVELDRGASKLFLAGLVSFCRHVDGPIHEVGVQFVKHSVAPIIYDNITQALSELDWLARAVETTRSGSDPALTAR